MSRILPILAILGIGLTACMSAPQSLAPNSPADDAATFSSTFDTLKLSDDNVVLISQTATNNFAARPMVMDVGDGILRTMKWPNLTTIRVSLHGSYPSNARGVLDTATRYWASLINPNSPKLVAFKIVGDNDASAQLKVYFPAGTSGGDGMAVASRSVSLLPSDPSVLTTSRASITYFEQSGGIKNDWTNQNTLFNVTLHELGHVLGLDDERDNAYINEVMYYENISKNRQFFGSDDVASINLLFNWTIRIEGNTTYIDQVRNPYQPFFNVFSNGSVDPTPIIGWQSAKELYSQGKSLRLMGILHDRFAGDANKVNISLMQATRGANLYSRFSYGGDLNSTLRSYNNGSDCPDMAIPNQMAMPTFALLPENTVHPILRARIVTALYTGTSKKIVWGSDAPSNCKDRLGAFYDLRTKI